MDVRDPLHDEVDLLLEDSDVKHRDHVRVCELRECLSLREHAVTRGRELCLQELDRDAPIELGIERTPYDAHAARADRFEQMVATERDALLDGE